MIKGKLVVIDNLNLFKTMQQSSDPIPDSAVVFIKNEGQLWTKGSYFGVQKTYTTVSKTDAGLAPKGGDSASSQISNVDTEWVLTVTSGASPSWRKLPANAFKNTTYTFYNLAFKNSAGTTVDTYKPTTSPTKTIKAGSNVTISASDDVITIAATDTTYSVMGGASANNDGTSGLVPQPTKRNQAKFLRADGSWAIPTNTTYSVVTAAKNGLVPMFDAADGTIDAQDSDWVLTNNNGSIGWYKLPANAFNNSTYSVMSGATTSADGTQGLVPKPTKSDVDMFLKGDGTWATPTNTTYSVVTKTANGLVPKTGTSASATISSEANEWVLTTTSGNTPTWRKLPSAAFTTAYYTLPTATTSALGGIKVGSVNTDAFANLSGKFYSVNVDKNGLAYVQVPWTDTKYTLPTATSSKLGGVKVGTTLTDVTGYTAVHIKDGVIYYKDTNSTNYLPLSGGTLTGGLTINTNDFGSQLSIYKNNDSGNSVILFHNSSGHLGTLGVCGSAGVFPGQLYFQNSAGIESRIWHSQNDGSDSGLDADLLDGNHATQFFGKGWWNEYNHNKSISTLEAVNSSTNAWNSEANVTLKLVSSNNTIVLSAGGTSNEKVGLIQVGHASTGYAQHTGSLYLNKLGGKVYIGTTEAATINSNVASATKLQTARTIWGKSFDGTSDITTGELTILPNSGGAASVNLQKAANDVIWQLSGRYTEGETGFKIYYYDKTQWNNYLYIGTNGNVGIGTDSPSSSFKLHVVGSTGVTGSLQFIRNATTYQLADISTTDTNGFQFEAPRKTNSASGEYLPHTFSWRGGWDNYQGIQFNRDSLGTHINIKHSTASLKLFAYNNNTCIESGNTDFTSSAPLYITGKSAENGPDLYLKFNNTWINGTTYGTGGFYVSKNHGVVLGLNAYARSRIIQTGWTESESDFTTIYIPGSANINDAYLKIRQYDLIYNGNTVIHSGNWSSFITASAGSSYLGVQDTRSDNTNSHSGIVSWHLKYNSIVGLSAANSSTYSGVLQLSPWGDASGGVNYQVAFCGNGNDILYRSNTGTWNRILDSNNYSSYCMSANNPTASGTLMMNGSNSRGSYPSVKWHISGVNWAQILMNGSGELECRGGAAQDDSYTTVRMGACVCTSLHIGSSQLTFVT